MTYYYKHLDVDRVISLAERAGNCAHEMRNFCQGYVRLDLPELLTIDNLSGQIEGVCRDLVSQIEMRLNFKESMKNIVRPTIFLEKLLKDDSLPKYVRDGVENSSISKLQELLALQKSAIREINDQVNNAIMKDSEENFGDDHPKVEIKQQELNDEIPIRFSVPQDWTQFVFHESKPIEEFRNISLVYSQLACNRAHEIQNMCSPYIRVAKNKAVANKIIGLAGQIENKTRRVQQVITNHRFGKDDLQGVINVVNAMCDESKVVLDQINQQITTEVVPPKLINENFHNAYSMLQLYSDQMKANFQVGYVAVA